MKRKIKRQDKIILQDQKACQNFLFQLAEGFQKQQILLLQGPMGVGKTQFVSWLAAHSAPASSALDEAAASPTYAFHHRYQTAWGHLEHFDLDRVQSVDDLESIGFWDVFANTASWVIIEWPERVPLRELPRHWGLAHVILSRLDGESPARQLELIIYE